MGIVYLFSCVRYKMCQRVRGWVSEWVGTCYLHVCDRATNYAHVITTASAEVEAK